MGPDPQRPRLIYGQRSDPGGPVWQPYSLSEIDKTSPVVPKQPQFCAHPQVAIGGLRHRRGKTARPTDFDLKPARLRAPHAKNDRQHSAEKPFGHPPMIHNHGCPIV